MSAKGALPARGARRRSRRLATLAAVAAVAMVSATAACGGEPDSGLMFQRLRHLRDTEPAAYASYLLRSVRAVGDVAAACGWAASGVIDATVDRVIGYLDATLPARDLSPAELRKRGLEAADGAAGRQVEGEAPDLARAACEREGKLYLDWIMMSETAGQPAPPLPDTVALDRLLGGAGGAPRARAIFEAGVMLLAVAERADACGAAPFARVQAFEERVLRDADALLRASGAAPDVAAGIARLLGSERVRSEQRDDPRVSCRDPQVAAGWQRWALAAQGSANLVEMALAQRLGDGRPTAFEREAGGRADARRPAQADVLITRPSCCPSALTVGTTACGGVAALLPPSSASPSGSALPTSAASGARWSGRGGKLA